MDRHLRRDVDLGTSGDHDSAIEQVPGKLHLLDRAPLVERRTEEAGVKKPNAASHRRPEGCGRVTALDGRPPTRDMGSPPHSGELRGTRLWSDKRARRSVSTIPSRRKKRRASPEPWPPNCVSGRLRSPRRSGRSRRAGERNYRAPRAAECGVDRCRLGCGVAGRGQSARRLPRQRRHESRDRVDRHRIDGRSSMFSGISADVSRRVPCPVVVVPPAAHACAANGRPGPDGVPARTATSPAGSPGSA